MTEAIAAIAAIAATLPGRSTSAAPAAPIAQLRADLDRDGQEDLLALGADGVLRLVGRGGEIRLAPSITSAQLASSRYQASSFVVAQLVTPSAPGAPPAREAVILVVDGSLLREVARAPLGATDPEEDHGVELEVTADAIYRYQTRSGLVRCDGKPALLFAEKFDGQRFRRASALPSRVDGAAPVLAATRDPARAARPLLYRARWASHQAGATDAGALAIPSELDDGQLSTVWHETLDASAGEGQLFTFEPRTPRARARHLRIVPGAPATPATMQRHGRPRGLAVVAGSEAWRIELPDAAREALGAAYVVELPHPVEGCVTVILESAYGGPKDPTAIAELELFADGERAGGGEPLLAQLVAEGGAGAVAAAAALAQRGPAGVAALEGALAGTPDGASRARLIGALTSRPDPTAGPTLARAALEGWVRGPDLADVLGALGALGDAATLRAVAGAPTLAVEARLTAIGLLPVTAAGVALLAEVAELAGGATGARPDDEAVRTVRRAVIARASAAPIPALLAAAQSPARTSAAAGDLWRAAVRAARRSPERRGEVLAALLAALPAATDYERRYRVTDGVAALGDADALAALEAAHRGLPAHERAALHQVALRAIAGAPRATALAFTLAQLTDRDPGVRMAALDALAGDPAAWRDGPAAAEAIAADDDTMDRAMAAAMTDAWPEVRRRAAAALGERCQRPGPASALVAAVDRDRELAVRGDALSAIVRCRAPAAGPLLRRVWEDDRAPIELRSRAVLEAAALGDAALARTLVERLRTWRADAAESEAALALAQSAATAIGRLRPPGAAEALLDTLADTASPELVQAAALGLAALGADCPPAAQRKLAELGGSDHQAAAAARRAAAQCGRARAPR